MSESLAEKRQRFTAQISKFVLQVNSWPDHAVAYNEIKREKAQALANAASGKGIANSLHLIGLAADILLFKHRNYCTDTADYKEMGTLWTSMGPDHRWGGAWGDGNHFSIEHNGVK